MTQKREKCFHCHDSVTHENCALPPKCCEEHEKETWCTYCIQTKVSEENCFNCQATLYCEMWTCRYQYKKPDRLCGLLMCHECFYKSDLHICKNHDSDEEEEFE